MRGIRAIFTGGPSGTSSLLSAIAAATQAVQRIRGRAGSLRVKWPVEAQRLRAAFASERQGSGAQWERHAGGAGSQNLLRELEVYPVVLLELRQLFLYRIDFLRRHLEARRQLAQLTKVGVPLVDVVDNELRS